MSGFIIPGTPKEYYTENHHDDGVISYKANRQVIRNYAQNLNDYHMALIQDGGDIYTSSIDENDKFFDFIAGEPIDARVEMINVLVQETDAITKRVIDKTEALNQEAAQKEETARNIGAFIAGIIVFIAVLVFISR